MGMHKQASIVVSGVLLIASAGLAAVQDTNDFKTDLDKISYIIGTNIATTLKNTGCEVNLDMLVRGLRESLAAKPSPFTPQQVTELMTTWQRMQMAKKAGGEIAWKLTLTKPEMMQFDANKDYFWILETNKGDIRIKLMPQVAPMHVTNVIFLTNKSFYDGTVFHRVIPGFMAQGGCPLGNGSGDPGYSLSGEFDPDVKHNRPFLVSTANRGPDTDGSQFFITFKPTPHLDGKHTIFGEVVEGQDTVKKLEAAGTPAGKPTEELIIKKARIEEKTRTPTEQGGSSGPDQATPKATSPKGEAATVVGNYLGAAARLDSVATRSFLSATCNEDILVELKAYASSYLHLSIDDTTIGTETTDAKGGTATVVVKMVFKGGNPPTFMQKERTFSLVLEKGVWKVSGMNPPPAQTGPGAMPLFR